MRPLGRATCLLAALLACGGLRRGAPSLTTPAASWAVPVQTSPGGPPLRYQALLVAADDSLPVFDNAVDRLARDLAPHAQVRTLSARRAAGAPLATIEATLAAIRGLRPTADQGCLVYITSHGARDAGLVFSADDDVLSPAALAAALARGCGASPTVVVLSGCYSGIYARPPLIRANRIVITAARSDRPSFGCGAGDVYTVFDQCMLTAIEDGGTWREALTQTRGCVKAEEAREQERPSEPQASFGADVAGLAVP